MSDVKKLMPFGPANEEQIGSSELSQSMDFFDNISYGNEAKFEHSDIQYKAIGDSDTTVPLTDMNPLHLADTINQCRDNCLATVSVVKSTEYENKQLLCSANDGMLVFSDGNRDLQSATNNVVCSSSGYKPEIESMYGKVSSVTQVIGNQDKEHKQEAGINQKDLDNNMSTVMTEDKYIDTAGSCMVLEQNDKHLSDSEDEDKRTIEIVFPNNTGVKESLTVIEGNRLVTVSLNIPSNPDDNCQNDLSDWPMPNLVEDESEMDSDISKLSGTSENCSSDVSDCQIVCIESSGKCTNDRMVTSVRNTERENSHHDGFISSALSSFSGSQLSCKQTKDKFDDDVIISKISSEKNDVDLTSFISLSEEEDCTSMDGCKSQSISHKDVAGRAEVKYKVDPGITDENMYKDFDKNEFENHHEILPEIGHGSQFDNSCDNHLEVIHKNLSDASHENQSEILSGNAASTSVVSKDNPAYQVVHDSAAEKDTQLSADTDDKMDSNKGLCVLNQDIKAENEDVCQSEINNGMLTDIIGKDIDGLCVDVQDLPHSDDESKRTIEIVVPNDIGMKQSLAVMEGNRLVTVSLNVPPNLDDVCQNNSSPVSSDGVLEKVKVKSDSSVSSDLPYICSRDVGDRQSMHIGSKTECTTVDIEENSTNSLKLEETINQSTISNLHLMDVNSDKRNTHSDGANQLMTDVEEKQFPLQSLKASIQKYWLKDASIDSGVMPSKDEFQYSDVLSSTQQPSQLASFSILNKDIRMKNLVCLSPECRSRYSHILNMPPVVLLNKLHIDGVSVKISGTTSDEQNLPKKKKRGRPRKKTRPAGSSWLKKPAECFQCKQYYNNQSALKLHIRLTHQKIIHETGNYEQHSKYLTKSSCVILEQLPVTLLPQNRTTSETTDLKLSTEKLCPENSAITPDVSKEKYSDVLNKTLSVSLERLPPPTLSTQRNKGKGSKLRQRSKSDLDKPEKLDEFNCLNPLPSLKGTDNFEQQPISPPERTEPSQKYGPFLKEKVVKSRKCFSKMTRPRKESCPKCHNQFTRRKLYNHFRAAHHDAQYPFCCSKCQKTFLFQDSFEKHRLTCSDKITSMITSQGRLKLKIVSCNVPDNSQFGMGNDESDEGLKQHSKICLSVANLDMDQSVAHKKQEQCLILNDSKKDRISSEKHHHLPDKSLGSSDFPTVMFRCLFCPKAFISKSLLTEHAKNIHTNASGLKADRKTVLMPELNKNSDEMDCNAEIVPEEEISVFLCTKCNRYFHKVSEFEEHQKLSHNVRKEQISSDAESGHEQYLEQMHDECCKTGNKEDNNKEDVIRKAGNSTFGSTECSLCCYKTQTFGGMQRHLRHEHGQHQLHYKCQFCSKIFIMPQSVECHALAVHGTHRNVMLPVSVIGDQVPLSIGKISHRTNGKKRKYPVRRSAGVRMKKIRRTESYLVSSKTQNGTFRPEGGYTEQEKAL